MTAEEHAGPIFVAGCGRSGTSFVRTLLDAHPDVWIPSETLCLVDYLQSWHALPPRVREWMFFHEPQVRCWYTGPARAHATAAATIAAVHEYEARRHGARVWGQKTPRFVRHIDLFQDAFPGARWVLLYRDPRGVVSSMLGSGQHTNSVAAAVERWKRDNAPVVELLRASSMPAHVTVLRYETLVNSFETTLDMLWDRLGLARVDAEQVLANARPVFFSRSRFPINTIREGMRPKPEVLDAWRSRLSPEQIAQIEDRCADEMELMGYSRSDASGRPPTHRGDVRGRVKDVIIPLRYAWFWPEYPAFVALRRLVLSILGRTRR